MKNELQKRILSSIILIPITFFFIIKGSYFFNFLLLICLAITIYEWHAMAKEKYYKIFGYIFILTSFYSVYLLRNDFNGKYTLFLLILFICISTDLGGYFFGKIIKGPKLTKISPNKTWSGFFGGILSAFIIGVLVAFILRRDILLYMSLISVLIGTLSQAGDLLESWLKRRFNKKDSGSLIPGHGGLFDRVDGLLPAATALWLVSFWFSEKSFLLWTKV